MFNPIPIEYLWLIPLGFVLGSYGTLIGAGGGFVLVPVLLMLYPHDTTDIITGISLAVVFFNALSGTLAYARMRRIEYRSGIAFSLATIPGAILGALATSYVPRRFFDPFFGLALVAISFYLVFRSEPRPKIEQSCPPNHRECLVTDTDGASYRFSYHRTLGISMSGGVGFLSSLLGIGGGPIYVPILVRLLNFPILVATATSQFVLTTMALAGTLTHIAAGTFTSGFRRTVVLAIGVILGAQFGARLSRRIRGKWIIRGLAIALAVVGIRLLAVAL